VRRTFAKILEKEMEEYEDIVVVGGDLGYRMFDRIRERFPGRFYNVGAAEQAMMGVGVGLAMEGKIPFVYSITPFLLYRPFETIRNYINHEKIGVKLIGSGRDRDYSHDGFSHWAEEDRGVMELFDFIDSHWPEDKRDIPGLVRHAITTPKPVYINLKR
jgi:transketolase